MKRRKSKTLAAIKSDVFGPGRFHALLAEDCFHRAEEVRHFNAGWGFQWQKASHDAFALGKLDLLAVAQELLFSGKTVTEVAKGGSLHEAHFIRNGV